MLANIVGQVCKLARFAIPTNMLANIVGQVCKLARFAIPTNMLANISSFERLFERLTNFRMFFYSIEKKRKHSFNHLIFKMADSKCTNANKFRWDDEDVDKLIDLYEARPCLWDIADRSYSKRDIKEKALSEIKEELGIEIAVIKAKWNSMRAQHGRELTKENKTKSVQSAGEDYESHLYSK